MQKAIDESIIDPHKTLHKTPSKSPYKTPYRSTGHPALLMFEDVGVVLNKAF
jgi:hypothetical protein